MLSTRGAILAVGAAGAALAGLAYGVEEFVLMAIAVAVLLALAKLWVAEVTAGHSAVVVLTVTNLSRRRRPPVVVEDPDGKWSVSYPGLGESSIAGASRAHPGRGTSSPEDP